jgi:hypothetical protein
MKNIFYMTLLAILGCNNKAKKSDTVSKPSVAFNNSKTQYYTIQDTLIITTETGDTFRYDSASFNKIIDNFPALYRQDTRDPDETYFGTEIWKDVVDKNGKTVHLTFGSEAGQDGYYILYAYFLKQKNGIVNQRERRNKLIDIYSNINSLFGNFQYGGTFFGHQSYWLLAYAEYSVYLYIQNEKFISKTYDISKQKALYIKSLRQLIEDESKIDPNTLGQDKIKRNKELNLIVDKIAGDITDNYYLRRTQQFHYDHYEYY